MEEAKLPNLSSTMAIYGKQYIGDPQKHSKHENCFERRLKESLQMIFRSSTDEDKNK